MAHLCHALHCTIPIAPRLLMCSKHWRMVPKELRDAIWATYRPGQETDKQPSQAYLDAAMAALTAVAQREGLYLR